MRSRKVDALLATLFKCNVDDPESPPSMLLAYFVGASNFVNPYPNSILNPTAVQSSRSLNIMSPYDSIASNSPQADAFPQFSLNGMTYPNKDFQFPCCGRSSDDRMDGVSNNVY
ncbi:hypothetical protein EVAR_100284_1 [Eumeta japonica]|uniref:Uncharacterized protein n=1 Tax=Eumeta variegata TaxID=151549 RepID=A0A4C2A8K4_EUMVA|nr:hypothetical protein EVAR_100284_1 [Eumeta japonica]